MKITLSYNDYDFSNLLAAAEKVLLKDVDIKLSMEIVFLSRRKIKKLNFNSRGINKATDVLSYPSLANFKDNLQKLDSFLQTDGDGQGGIFIGSIAICKPICKAQAKSFGHSFKREVNYLAAHGILHLLGYDHKDEEERQVMRDIEREIMDKMGLNR